MSLKRTAFYRIHQRLGAKIVDFAEFQMPVLYTGIVEEHARVRECVGLFDVSHMGEFEVRGSDALAFVQRMTVNDAFKLSPGRVQYSVLCYEDGGIVDDLLVYHLGDYLLLVVNAANIEKDYAWLNEHRSGDVELRNCSSGYSLLAIQGPQSLATLQNCTDADLSHLPYYHSLRTRVGGVDMLVSRTGYTGELGFEIYFSADEAIAEDVWNTLMSAGEPFGIGPVGLGARDTLRLEMGYCLYGYDIDRTTNPLEAGLGWITKMEKGMFVGREALQAVKQGGIKRRLVGFMLEEKAIPRQGYPVHAEGVPVGAVTSGTFSPTLQRGIGMGYIEISRSKPGTPITIVIRDKLVPATVVSLPFVKR